MSDSPFLNKMDALLKKHRGDGENSSDSVPGPEPAHERPAEQTPPPDAWLPVLTQVIERGTPPAAAALAAEPALPADLPAEPEAPVPDAVAPDASEPLVSDTLAEQLMSELTPRLSEVMEKKLAAELRKNLDQTVATLLSQLDVNVREIVRDAVAEKLRPPRDPKA